MHEQPEWILVGRVKRPHGMTGEVLVQVLSDREERFAAGSVLQLSGRDAGSMEPVTVRRARKVEAGLLVAFEGIDARERARDLTGAGLFIPIADLAPAGADSYYAFQLEGCSVFRGDECIGRVVSLNESVANAYLEVEGADGSFLIPFVRQAVLAIDLDERRITIADGFSG